MLLRFKNQNGDDVWINPRFVIALTKGRLQSGVGVFVTLSNGPEWFLVEENGGDGTGIVASIEQAVREDDERCSKGGWAARRF